MKRKIARSAGGLAIVLLAVFASVSLYRYINSESEVTKHVLPSAQASAPQTPAVVETKKDQGQSKNETPWYKDWRYGLLTAVLLGALFLGPVVAIVYYASRNPPAEKTGQDPDPPQRGAGQTATANPQTNPPPPAAVQSNPQPSGATAPVKQPKWLQTAFLLVIAILSFLLFAGAIVIVLPFTGQHIPVLPRSYWAYLLFPALLIVFSGSRKWQRITGAALAGLVTAIMVLAPKPFAITASGQNSRVNQPTSDASKRSPSAPYEDVERDRKKHTPEQEHPPTARVFRKTMEDQPDLLEKVIHESHLSQYERRPDGTFDEKTVLRAHLKDGTRGCAAGAAQICPPIHEDVCPGGDKDPMTIQGNANCALAIYWEKDFDQWFTDPDSRKEPFVYPMTLSVPDKWIKVKIPKVFYSFHFDKDVRIKVDGVEQQMTRNAKGELVINLPNHVNVLEFSMLGQPTTGEFVYTFPPKT